MIPTPSLDLNADTKKLDMENFMVNYINKIIAFDVSIGRSKDNFFPEEFKNVTTNIEKIKAEDVRVFIGGGNMFFLKTHAKLTGWHVQCVQVRGLARRTIHLKEMLT